MPISTSSGRHFVYLDGLRGLTALYVVFHHAFADFRLHPTGKVIPSWLHRLVEFTSFGQAAVCIFIVLSGYCLMMPLVQAKTTYLRGGVFQYILRRARRILPVYYGAMVVSLLLIALIPGMTRISNTLWDDSLPAFSSVSIFSHLLLIHNFNYFWMHKIDYPMWSVATEWQIYFVFALVLLPVWRRFGLAASVITAMVIGLIPHWVSNGTVDMACFEFVGLFALGMAGAVISFSTEPIQNRIRDQIPWGSLSVVFLLAAYFGKFRARREWIYQVIGNVDLGFAAACLLIFCTKALLDSELKKLPVVVRFLKSKIYVFLGTFSYSLYLIHAPALALVGIGIRQLNLSSTGSAAVLLIAAIPFTLIAAYLFYLVFEKPFLVRGKSKIPML